MVAPQGRAGQSNSEGPRSIVWREDNPCSISTGSSTTVKKSGFFWRQSVFFGAINGQNPKFAVT
jgi:hypothetical protein